MRYVYVDPYRVRSCQNVRYVYPYRRQRNNDGLLLLAAASLLFIPFWGVGGCFFW